MSSVTATPIIARPPRVPQLRDAVRAAPAGGVVRWGDVLGLPAPSRAECEALDALAVVRAVAAGQAVFAHGQSSRTLVVLLSGDVALGMAMPGGAMRTERLVHGPAWLDASSVWLDSSHVLDAVALTPVRVAELARDPLQVLFDQRPSLAQRMLVSLAGEVRRLTMQTHELMHKDAPARLASWLAARQLPVDADPNRAVVQLAERKSDIASQLGMTPETMSRLMRTLSDQGVIEVEGYTVRVLDVPALRRIGAG
ncbi:MAG: Crp/Fnr family transcriptional regulator [Rhizobacter sp.]|jgi:CRP-like cAMP-binding protein|nr:Crp/Fnr family transcriptional regulator [Burkholderiaceae bacterium]MCO5124225.1 Crp/Fnr family transcriptional regulator [Rhizobacter sp.]